MAVFLVFQWSHFPPVAALGLLAAGTCAAGLACALALLPALMVVFNPHPSIPGEKGE
jgi:predicted RND superfamily exporter protein